jgi:DNA-binding NarL/FixJ family response regulator
MTSQSGGIRAFIVEDEAIVLLELSLALEDLGYVIAGTASNLETGVALAHELSIDIGLLDINLGGCESWPIASVLEARHIPFVFMSGYTRASLPQGFAHRPLISKPYDLDALNAALRAVRSAANSLQK